MSSSRHDNGRGFDRGLGGIPRVYDQSGIWFEQEVAATTAEQSSGDQGVAAEGVAAVKLLVHRLAATWATKLAVECFLCLGLGRQDILVPLNQLPRKFLVEFAEHRHG